ncbi:MAG: hypothetical protein A2057_05425 [Ignavibacteria bacterium GWA2_35_9]|nr:MAG: hypothetical protein A2057_05425 [Ignavibacteria bacterium GWA2_35_9]OGU47221.1 MAG: hypothetical protein A2000_00790 [Ignavibacteria bacterium GWB2_36_8]OGU50100.1 MAG: hypothetical protein A2080_11765 [Ignavibacteria bacterium GWC2_36_12]OGV03226.1 MAG: hypothetical protein A2330_08085 [Ignavibacteria bacterium RIFOXYB2_FULL_36_7]
MAKRRGRKSVPRNRYKEYENVAEHFYEAAKDSMELEYWTAAGVLIVHSAIAYTDSLCIKLAGVKSIGEDHEEAVNLLENSVAEGEEKSKAINQLRRLIEEKTKVSYLGELYSTSQTKEMWKRLERFRKWAIEILMR